MATVTPTPRGTWGGNRAVARHLGLVPWADVLVALGIAGLFIGIMVVGGEFRKPVEEAQRAIPLDIPHLALFSLYSLARAMIAYLLSLAFAIAYGYWAAKDRIAEKILLPLLDILQSIPVLAFMPGVMLAFIALFPTNEIGRNLASIILIFTGQVWNMVFSFYHSIRTIPPELYEAGYIYRFGWWRRFSRIELPSSTVGMVWNSMMSMAGGWFFLMLCETMELGPRTIRLLGLGTYMTAAQDQGDFVHLTYGVIAMVLIIVFMNQLLWRPLTVWAQRFKIEDVSSGRSEDSLVLDLLRKSRLLWLFHRGIVTPVRTALDRWDHQQQERPSLVSPRLDGWWKAARWSLWLGLIVMAGWGLYLLASLLRRITGMQWTWLLGGTGLTLLRVLAAVGLGTLWMVPLGVVIGLRPRLASRLQPVIQVLASFPAPMLFALFLLVFDQIGLNLAWGSIFLMIAGTQWYILFNVLGGAMAIPNDLHEAAAIYRWGLREKWLRLYLPAIFPFLVTGWVTAAGGAWNTSIVAEYWKVPGVATEQAADVAAHQVQPWENVFFEGKPPESDRVRRCFGLGAIINRASEQATYAILVAGALLMAATVVFINRFIWRRLQLMAEHRFSLSR